MSAGSEQPITKNRSPLKEHKQWFDYRRMFFRLALRARSRAALKAGMMKRWNDGTAEKPRNRKRWNRGTTENSPES